MKGKQGPTPTVEQIQSDIITQVGKSYFMLLNDGTEFTSKDVCRFCQTAVCNTTESLFLDSIKKLDHRKILNTIACMLHKISTN